MEETLIWLEKFQSITHKQLHGIYEYWRRNKNILNCKEFKNIQNFELNNHRMLNVKKGKQ